MYNDVKEAGKMAKRLSEEVLNSVPPRPERSAQEHQLARPRDMIGRKRWHGVRCRGHPRHAACYYGDFVASRRTQGTPYHSPPAGTLGYGAAIGDGRCEGHARPWEPPSLAVTTCKHPGFSLQTSVI